MATTTRHRALVGKLITEKGGISLYRAMISVGYSHNTAITPAKVTKSEGFQDLLEKHLSDAFLLEALEEDIKNNKGKRKGEIELAFKVKGRLSNNEQPPSPNQYNIFVQNNRIDPNAPSARTMADKMLEVAMEQTKRKVIDNE